MTQVGLSTALGIDHLPLLPSGPDGVRGFPPRRARLSTSNCGHWPVAGPLRGIQPCCSGLQVQGTASSPPSTTNFIIASQLLHCQTKRAHDFTNRHQNTANETKVYYLPLATLSRKALIESRVPLVAFIREKVQDHRSHCFPCYQLTHHAIGGRTSKNVQRIQ